MSSAGNMGHICSLSTQFQGTHCLAGTMPGPGNTVVCRRHSPALKFMVNQRMRHKQVFRIRFHTGCYRSTPQGHTTFSLEWEDDGRSMGLPKGNDAQAAILSREECSKQKEQLVRKARGQRAMCMWATCRYTIMYLGFHIECEPRDRERGHAEGVG